MQTGMATEIEKSISLPSILPNVEEAQHYNNKKTDLLGTRPKKKRQNSVTNTHKEKYAAFRNNLGKMNKRDNSSQTEFEWDWVAVSINTFLGILLPTFDIYSDLLFVLGTLQLLETETNVYLRSKQEAGSMR